MIAHLVLLAAGALGAAPPPPPPPAQAARGAAGWRTQVEFRQLRDEFAAAPDKARMGDYPGWKRFGRTTTLPASLRTRVFDHASFAVVDVAASGEATACRVLRPTDEPRLDRLACELLEDDNFRFFLDFTNPKPTTFVVGVRIRNVDPATAAREAAIPAPVIVPVSPPKP
jgi:hypothetical protein